MLNYFIKSKQPQTTLNNSSVIKKPVKISSSQNLGRNVGRMNTLASQTSNMKDPLLHSITSNTTSHRDYGKSTLNAPAAIKHYQSNHETRRNSRDIAVGKALNFMKESEDASKCVYDAYLITNTSGVKQQRYGEQATATIDLTSRNAG